MVLTCESVLPVNQGDDNTEKKINNHNNNKAWMLCIISWTRRLSVQCSARLRRTTRTCRWLMWSMRLMQGQPHHCVILLPYGGAENGRGSFYIRRIQGQQRLMRSRLTLCSFIFCFSYLLLFLFCITIIIIMIIILLIWALHNGWGRCSVADEGGRGQGMLSEVDNEDD